MKACGEHVNPESTCTIRLCLLKQESPDFRQEWVQKEYSSYIDEHLFIESINKDLCLIAQSSSDCFLMKFVLNNLNKIN